MLKRLQCWSARRLTHFSNSCQMVFFSSRYKMCLSISSHFFLSLSLCSSFIHVRIAFLFLIRKSNISIDGIAYVKYYMTRSPLKCTQTYAHFRKMGNEWCELCQTVTWLSFLIDIRFVVLFSLLLSFIFFMLTNFHEDFKYLLFENFQVVEHAYPHIYKHTQIEIVHFSQFHFILMFSRNSVRVWGGRPYATEMEHYTNIVKRIYLNVKLQFIYILHSIWMTTDW